MSPSACHTTGDQQASVRRPWAGDPRADAKDALLDYALNNPPEVVLKVAAREALGSEPGVTDADHQLARRFYTDNYAHLFKTTKRDGLRWVKPEPWAFVLKSSRQAAPETPAGDVDPARASGSLPSRAPSGRAASVARSVLRDRCSVTPGERGEGVRAALVHALAAHREGVDSAGMRADRVSSPSRVAGRQGGFLSAFEAASRRYRRGTLLSLTTRPGESGDGVDTNVAVNESVEPLRKWIGRRTPGEGAADVMVVRELTERGVLHLHVVVFGVSPFDFDRDALGRYWHETRGHGYVVDLAPVERRPSRSPSGPRFRWVFGDHPGADAEKGQFVRSYLGEGLHRLRAVAEASPEELHRREVEGAWRVAVLWATGLPFVTVSPALRTASVFGGCGGREGTRGTDVQAGAYRIRGRRRGRECVRCVRGLDPPVWEFDRDRPPPDAGKRLPASTSGRCSTDSPKLRRRRPIRCVRRPGVSVSPAAARAPNAARVASGVRRGAIRLNRREATRPRAGGSTRRAST